ncbi:MAG: hypothetical protein GXP24_11495 [Planctomycetes bacterium]|nr:hypothetical protein [Planctomycetota bacterium]
MTNTVLWNEYPRYRISPAIHSDLRHADVVRQLTLFQDAHSESVEISQLGESVEGRSISMLTLGDGPKNALAWSQMHGNEPTHTAALFDLINFLLEMPEHPTAEAILSGCKLHFLLMLNPDGAERWTRRNAQDIDINRDALHLQSPEGRILRDVVNDLQPDFALNLHNQRPRTTVEQSQQVASFSLLVPPIDQEDTEAEHVVRAKRLAGYLAEAVAPHCPGPVSRYDADFMPRCFGEWVQQQGAATLTIEAGGWSTVDAEPLVQLHFFGLVSALQAIATDSFLEVAPEVYEDLRRTGEHDLFGKLLRDVTILNGAGQRPFCGDIGINFSQIVPTPRGGKIVDLGDLHVTTGKRVTHGSDLVCLPGRIAWLADATPGNFLDNKKVAALLDQGVTTVLGQVDLSADDDLTDLEAFRTNFSSPINVGFLAKLSAWSPEILDRLLQAISQGILGVLAEGLPTEVELYLSLFNFPIVPGSVLLAANDSSATYAECAAHTQQCAQHLGLDDRGAIRLGATADLILLQAGAEFDPAAAFGGSDLQRVIVGGNVVFDEGQTTDSTAGELLSGRYFN